MHKKQFYGLTSKELNKISTVKRSLGKFVTAKDGLKNLNKSKLNPLKSHFPVFTGSEDELLENISEVIGERLDDG